MTERPKLSDPARATLGLQQWRDGRVHCSAWLYAGHALAELLGKGDNDALRPADVG